VFATIREFFRNMNGGVAVMFAGMAPALLAVMAVAADYVNMGKIREELQVAADAAALAGAKEFRLAGSTDKQIVAIAEAFARTGLGMKPDDTSLSSAPDGADAPSGNAGQGPGGGAELGNPGALALAIHVDRKKGSVEVTLARYWTPFFLHFVSADMTPVRASARAQVLDTSPTCVLGLSENFPSGVTLWKNASLTGENCVVYSNTNTPAGISVSDNATLNAAAICVAGGYVAPTAKSLQPVPTTDCPMFADPLASRTPPKVGPCDYTLLVIKDQIRTLDPGVYCGGLTISGKAKVTFNPGTYIIHNGLFLVLDTATIHGEHVGFYLSGNATMFMFDSGTTADLAAPVGGPLAGLLFFEDRKTLPLRVHRIGSNNARRLIGTIYLSRGTLLIDANAPVADNSAYTALVVRSLQLKEGPKVVLRSDFDATDVPVPEGLLHGRVVLSE
jgi:hypothetical protein